MTFQSHRDAMILHALRRFKERCGRALSRHEYDALCEHIRRGGPELDPCGETQDGQPLYRVRVYGNQIAYALWLPEQELIVTFFPRLNWLQRIPQQREAEVRV